LRQKIEVNVFKANLKLINYICKLDGQIFIYFWTIVIALKRMDIANFTRIIINPLWICRYQIKGGSTIWPQHEAKKEALIISTHSIQDFTLWDLFHKLMKVMKANPFNWASIRIIDLTTTNQSIVLIANDPNIKNNPAFSIHLSMYIRINKQKSS